MRKFVILCSAAMVMGACNQPLFEEDVLEPEVQSVVIDNPLLPPPIIFNPFTGNPYAVSTMREAFIELKDAGDLPADADVEDYIYTSHLYVKFSPESEEQIDALMADSTMILYNYPIDNEMTEENDEYTIRPEEGDTTTVHFYTAIPSDKVLPADIPYAILEELYIPDECSGNNTSPSMKTVSGDDISENIINSLVDKAFLLAGDIVINPQNNPDAEQMSNQYNELWRPEGNISAYDDIWGGQVPLQGIEVRARRWFTTHKGTTDVNGNFVCDGTFRKAAVYSFKWKGEHWEIRNGSTAPAYYRGPKQIGYWNLCIESGKSLAYAAIHRAAYRWYHGNVQGLTRPGNVRKEKIAYFHKPHPNTTNLSVTYGDYRGQGGGGGIPDIRIWGKMNGYEMHPVSLIFKAVCHELGHAAHNICKHDNYTNSSDVVRNSWARCVEFLLTNQEYTEKNALNKLYDYRYITKYDEINGEIITYNVKIMIPDDTYNYQVWKNTDDEQEYIPLCIDLVDDYNQFEYFVVMNLSSNSNTAPNAETNDYLEPIFQQPYLPSQYPKDNVCIPPHIVEHFVFNNTSISAIKNAIIQYIQSNPTDAQEYDLTEHSVGQLFYNYGY